MELGHSECSIGEVSESNEKVGEQRKEWVGDNAADFHTSGDLSLFGKRKWVSQVDTRL